MGGISFSQQEYDKILRVVEMMQEDFLSESKIFQNRMQEIVLESKNKRFTDILLKLFDDYNGWVAKTLKSTIMDSWKNSSAGLGTSAKRFGAGAEAEKAGKKVEQGIETLSDVSKTFKGVDLPDTSIPILDAEYYNHMIDAIGKYCAALSKKKDSILRDINKKSEQNQLFKILTGVCEAMYATSIGFWDKQKGELEKERDNFTANLNKKFSGSEAADEASANRAANQVEGKAGGQSSLDSHGTGAGQAGSGQGGSGEAAGGENGSGKSGSEDDSSGQTDSGAGNGNVAKAEEGTGALSEPYASYLRQLKERFLNEPQNPAVFAELAKYMDELAEEMADEGFFNDDAGNVLRKLAVIAETYLIFGGKGWEFTSGKEKWKSQVNYEYFHIFANSYGNRFADDERRIFVDDEYSPESYVTIAHMIQGMCRLQEEPSDIKEVTDNFVAILTEELALDNDKRKEYPYFSYTAAKMIQQILDGGEIVPENLSGYGRLAEEAGKAGDGVFASFRQLTDKIYHMLFEAMGKKYMQISPRMVEQLMPIYEEFYQEFGEGLRLKTINGQNIYDFGDEELIKVSFNWGNHKFCEECEWEVFMTAAHGGVAQRYDIAARMEKNIAAAVETGEATVDQLVYGMYVVTLPIIKGEMNEEDEKELNFAAFGKSAKKRILEILGQPIEADGKSQEAEEEEAKKEETKKEETEEAKSEAKMEAKAEEPAGEKQITMVWKFDPSRFTEENLQIFWDFMDKVAERFGGIDELNATFRDNEIRIFFKKKSQQNEVLDKEKPLDNTDQKAESNKKERPESKHGRYAVDGRTIQFVKNSNSLDKVHQSVVEADKKYREQHEKIVKWGRKIQNVHNFAKIVSTGLGLFAFAKPDSEIKPEQYTETASGISKGMNRLKEVFDKISKGVESGADFMGNASEFINDASKEIERTSAINKLFPWITKRMNKGRNKVKKIDPGMMELVKDTMISPTESYVDTYMMQHYQLMAMGDLESGFFEFGRTYEILHCVTAEMKEKVYRNWIEASMFWANICNNGKIFGIANSRELKGNFFNLTAAAVLTNKWYDDEKEALDLVDKAYDYCKKQIEKPDISKNPIDRLPDSLKRRYG